MSKLNKEPLLHITKRKELPLAKTWAIRIGAIVAALIVSAIVTMLLTGLDPFSVFGTMIYGAVGTERKMLLLLKELAVLLSVALALTPAFKMKFWNLGGEGQILMGAWATALCMIYMGDSIPSGLLIIICLAAAIICGAIWAVIPAFFKAKWNTNETLFTLMMNYVATSIVACMTNILRGKASSLGKLNMSTQVGWFPQFLGQRYNINILIVVILMFVMFFYLKYSKQGYEITVVGESENTARYAGINVKWVTIRTMIISGAICGLVGFLIVAGRDQTISTTSAGGNGFTAIIVAWLAKFNTFYMALISFLLIFLSKGAAEIASAYSLNDYAASIIEGVILFFILGSEFFINYKMIFRGSKKEVH